MPCHCAYYSATSNKGTCSLHLRNGKDITCIPLHQPPLPVRVALCVDSFRVSLLGQLKLQLYDLLCLLMAVSWLLSEEAFT